jgi:hypothetical protein
LRKNRGTLLLFSLVAILSWFVATNHCAIAGELTTPSDSAPSGLEHCPTHGGKPDTKEHGEGQMICCSALKISLNPEQSLVTYHASFFILKWFVPEFGKPRFIELSSTWHCDHGPPKLLSFAEQVLQRCILSNAPPVLG